MANKDAWIVLKCLFGFPIALLLIHLNCEDGPLNHIRQRSTGVLKYLWLMNGPSDNFDCYNALDIDYGTLGNKQKVGLLNRTCEKHNEGSQYRVDGGNPVLDNCVLQVMKDLQRKARALVVRDLPEFVAELSEATVQHHQEVTESVATVQTIVEILSHIANISQNITINKPEMEDILQTVDILVSSKSRKTWQKLNSSNMTVNTSTQLLHAVEDISSHLIYDSFLVNKTSIQLINTVIENSYKGKSSLPNSTTEILIPQVLKPTSVTIIIFTTLDNVLATRDTNKDGSGKRDVCINGDVVVVKVNQTVNNISFAFDINDQFLGNPQCVFWNFDLSAWDSTGCEVKPYTCEENETEKILCVCNHTTSFSILMSPFFIDDVALDYITYACLGISLVSLVICLIIEAIAWEAVKRNDTSYMRHVIMVNTAVSRLIADTCFIIGASIVQPGEFAPVGQCTAVAFLMHLFYLALFFWMLCSALLLFFRTVMVFSRMSKVKMMVIAFTLGYGTPLLIVIITYALTSGKGKYILEADVCWLNWDETKALQVFVSLAISFIAINILVLTVVLYKFLRNIIERDETSNRFLMLTRALVILTPIFGLTWAFGIGTMVSPAYGIHLVFTILNSLQGFFMLVFGLLMDSKIRVALSSRNWRLGKSIFIRRRNIYEIPGALSSRNWRLGKSIFRRRRNIYEIKEVIEDGSFALQQRTGENEERVGLSEGERHAGQTQRRQEEGPEEDRTSVELQHLGKSALAELGDDGVSVGPEDGMENLEEHTALMTEENEVRVELSEGERHAGQTQRREEKGPEDRTSVDLQHMGKSALAEQGDDGVSVGPEDGMENLEEHTALMTAGEHVEGVELSGGDCQAGQTQRRQEEGPEENRTSVEFQHRPDDQGDDGVSVGPEDGLENLEEHTPPEQGNTESQNSQLD